MVPCAARLVGVLVIPQAIGICGVLVIPKQSCYEGCCYLSCVWFLIYCSKQLTCCPSRAKHDKLGNWPVCQLPIAQLHCVRSLHKKKYRNGVGGDPPGFFIFRSYSKHLTCCPSHAKHDKLDNWPVCQLPNCSAIVAQLQRVYSLLVTKSTKNGFEWYLPCFFIFSCFSKQLTCCTLMAYLHTVCVLPAAKQTHGKWNFPPAARPT